MWLFAKTWGVRILATVWLISNCKINKNGVLAKSTWNGNNVQIYVELRKKSINDKANYNMHILTNWKYKLFLEIIITKNIYIYFNGVVEINTDLYN